MVTPEVGHNSALERYDALIELKRVTLGGSPDPAGYAYRDIMYDMPNLVGVATYDDALDWLTHEPI